MKRKNDWMKPKLREQEAMLKFAACFIAFLIGFPILMGAVADWLGLTGEAAVALALVLLMFTTMALIARASR